MISHQLIDEKYKSLKDEWENFLKPFESQFEVKIYYNSLCPTLTDAENRKFKIDFANDRTNYNKFKNGKNAEPLSRALGAGRLGHRVLDLSAGLGVDAVFLAQLGYHVTGLERNPLIYLALKNALKNLTANYQDQLKFVFAEAREYISQAEGFDVVYFDPMFPQKIKSALPKQEMAFFKNLVGDDADASQVLECALDSKKFKRIVVKRPLSADALMKPSGNIKGKIIRYDIYGH